MISAFPVITAVLYHSADDHNGGVTPIKPLNMAHFPKPLNASDSPAGGLKRSLNLNDLRKTHRGRARLPSEQRMAGREAETIDFMTRAEPLSTVNSTNGRNVSISCL